MISNPGRFIWSWIIQLKQKDKISELPQRIYWTIEKQHDVTGVNTEGTLFLSGIKAKGIKIFPAKGVVQED